MVNTKVLPITFAFLRVSWEADWQSFMPQPAPNMVLLYLSVPPKQMGLTWLLVNGSFRVPTQMSLVTVVSL